MSDQPLKPAPALATRHPWRWALIWSVPITLWCVALGIAAVVLVLHFETWPSSGSDEWQRRGFVTFLQKAGVVLGLLAPWFAYRRWVPTRRRATPRVWLLVLPLLAICAVVGFYLAGLVLRGTITG